MEPSRRMRRVEPSGTVAITDRAKELRNQGVDVVQLSAGEPDFDTPPHVQEAAIEAIRSGFTKYTPSLGIPELRAAVARFLNSETGSSYEASNIAITTGGKFAIFSAVMALCEEGDEVLIFSPHWVSYPQMVRLAGAEPRFLSARRERNYKVTAAELEEALTPRTKLVIVNNPCNPTGAVYSRRDLEPLVQVLRRSGAFVLADEIYAKLVYDGVEFASLASFSELRDRLVIVNGFSKAYAMTGWRIGYLAAPREVVSEIAKVIGHSTSNPCSISQRAALAALEGDQSCVEEMRREFERRRDLVCDLLGEIPGLDCSRPEGAFYVLPDVSKYLGSGSFPTSVELCRWLLDRWHVAVVPGEPFGAVGRIRISFTSSEDTLREGLGRLAKAFRELREETQSPQVATTRASVPK